MADGTVTVSIVTTGGGVLIALITTAGLIFTSRRKPDVARDPVAADLGPTVTAFTEVVAERDDIIAEQGRVIGAQAARIAQLEAELAALRLAP